MNIVQYNVDHTQSLAGPAHYITGPFARITFILLFAFAILACNYGKKNNPIERAMDAAAVVV